MAIIEHFGEGRVWTVRWTAILREMLNEDFVGHPTTVVELRAPALHRGKLLMAHVP